LTVDESMIVVGNYHQLSAEEAVRGLLGNMRESGLTAIFCAHDSVAEVVLHVAVEYGVRVPEDLSVVGFDNLPFCAKLNPPLTSIHHPLRQVGAASAACLLELIDEACPEPREKLFDVYLVERATTAAPKGSLST